MSDSGESQDDSSSQDVSETSVKVEQIIFEHDVIITKLLFVSNATIVSPWFKNETSSNDLHWRLCTKRVEDQRQFFFQAATSTDMQSLRKIRDVFEKPAVCLNQMEDVMVKGSITFGSRVFSTSPGDYIKTGILYACDQFCGVRKDVIISGSDTFRVRIELLSPVPEQPSRASDDSAHVAHVDQGFMAAALEDKMFSDVVLQAGEKKFKAHRVVLGAASPVLKAMFQNECREKREGVVKMEGVREEVLHQALRYLYGGGIDTADTSIHQELLVFADRYQVAPLTSVCVNILVKDTSSDILPLLLLAETCNSSELKECMLGRFKRHPNKNELLKDDSLRAIEKTRPELLSELMKLLV